MTDFSKNTMSQLVHGNRYNIQKLSKRISKLEKLTIPNTQADSDELLSPETLVKLLRQRVRDLQNWKSDNKEKLTATEAKLHDEAMYSGTLENQMGEMGERLREAEGLSRHIQNLLDMHACPSCSEVDTFIDDFLASADGDSAPEAADESEEDFSTLVARWNASEPMEIEVEQIDEIQELKMELKGYKLLIEHHSEHHKSDNNPLESEQSDLFYEFKNLLTQYDWDVRECIANKKNPLEYPSSWIALVEFAQKHFIDNGWWDAVNDPPDHTLTVKVKAYGWYNVIRKEWKFAKPDITHYQPLPADESDST